MSKKEEHWEDYFKRNRIRSIPEFIKQHFRCRGNMNPTNEDVLSISKSDLLNSWLSMASVFELQRYQEINRKK